MPSNPSQLLRTAVQSLSNTIDQLTIAASELHHAGADELADAAHRNGRMTAVLLDSVAALVRQSESPPIAPVQRLRAPAESAFDNLVRLRNLVEFHKTGGAR